MNKMNGKLKLKRQKLEAVYIRRGTKERLVKQLNKMPSVSLSGFVDAAVNKYLDDISGKSDGLPDSELGEDKRRRPVAVDTESQPRP